jgi:20S proteasome subunit alpha 4
MSFSGLISDSRFLIDIARLESQSYRFSLDSTPSLDYIVRQVAFKMQDYTQKPGVRPFGLCCLLGGFNKNKEPALFSTEPSGFFSQWNNLEYEEGLLILIESMLEYVESGSKNIEVAIMRKGDVMEGVKDEEVDRISKLIEEKKKEKKEKN